MLNIPTTVHNNSFRNHYLLLLQINPDTYTNPAWIKLSMFMKKVKPECIYKSYYETHPSYYDTIQLESYFQGYLPEDCLEELVHLLDELCESLPHMAHNRILFCWKSTIIDY